MTEFDYKDHCDSLFDSKFMRWFHLCGSPALVQITKIEKGKEVTLPGGRKEKVPVITIKQVQGKIESIKPLVLNKTNKESLKKILGEKLTEWIGKEVVLFQDKTRGKEGGIVPCIRIRAPKPAASKGKSQPKQDEPKPEPKADPSKDPDIPF